MPSREAQQIRPDGSRPRRGTRWLRRLPARLRAKIPGGGAGLDPVGVCIDRRIVIAHSESGAWTFESTESHGSDAETAAALTALVDRCQLAGRPAVITLPPGHYSLVQIERPPVPLGELAEACRWKVKDLVDLPVEEAVVDVYDAASTRSRGDQAMVDVVVAMAESVRSVTALVRDCGLHPVGVTIAELALRSVAGREAPRGEPVATVALGARYGLVQITCDDALLFARRLDYGLRSLGDLDASATGVHSRLPLDLQRTLDYFDRNFDAGPVRRLLLTPDQAPFVEFMRQVGAESGLAVELLGASVRTQTAQEPSGPADTEATLALGGALGGQGVHGGQVVDLGARLATLPSRRFGLRALGASLAATLVLCVGFGLWVEARVESARATTYSLERDIDVLADELVYRGSALSERNADLRLLRDLKHLESESADKRRVLEALTGSTLGNAHGFSGHLAALGRGTPRDVWLTRVLLGHGGTELRLEGHGLEAADVPRFLEGLHGELVFNGTSFSTLRIDRGASDTEPVRFVLATPCLADPEAAGSLFEESVVPCAEPVTEVPTT